MKDDVWTLPLVLFAAGAVYVGCEKFFFPGGYAGHPLWGFLLALLLLVLAGVVLRGCCVRRTALWGALFLSGYNCAVYGLQVYLSRHFFGFGIRWLPYTGPMRLPVDIFARLLDSFLFDILPETVGLQLSYPLGWVICFTPLIYVLVCKKSRGEIARSAEK